MINPPTKFVGPCEIPCLLSCTVPAGRTLVVMPPTNKDWGDILCCPNEGCGITLMLVKEGKP